MIKRYLSAIVLAPLAGGAAVFLTGFIATVAADLHSIHEGITSSSGLAFWATIICFVYVLVVGTIAFVYARVSKRTPPLWVAFAVALVTGVIPFGAASWSEPTLMGALAFPALAAISAAATAWTFWKVALAPLRYAQ
jgi:hypothetical protein